MAARPTIPLNPPPTLSEDRRQAYLSALLDFGFIPRIRHAITTQMQGTGYDVRLQRRIETMVRQGDGQLTWEQIRDQLIGEIRQGQQGMALPQEVLRAGGLMVRERLAQVADMESKP